MATKTARRTEQDLLGVYLNDHLAGATVGVGLVRRMAASAEPGSETATVVKPLVSEITADRSALVKMMAVVGVKIRGYKLLAAWAGEKAGSSSTGTCSRGLRSAPSKRRRCSGWAWKARPPDGGPSRSSPSETAGSTPGNWTSFWPGRPGNPTRWKASGSASQSKFWAAADAAAGAAHGFAGVSRLFASRTAPRRRSRRWRRPQHLLRAFARRTGLPGRWRPPTRQPAPARRPDPGSRRPGRRLRACDPPPRSWSGRADRPALRHQAATPAWEPRPGRPGRGRGRRRRPPPGCVARR